MLLPYLLRFRPRSARNFSSMKDPHPQSFCRSAIFCQEQFYVGAGGTALAPPPPRITCFPQIQKLADRYDVISEVPKCSKIQIFWGLAPDPAGGAYSAPPDPLTDGKGAHYPPSRSPPCSRPFGPCFYGVRVGHEGADWGQCPQNLWARTAPVFCRSRILLLRISAGDVIQQIK